MLECVPQTDLCVDSCAHGIHDSIAFRLELNFLTVSFIRDADIYCYSDTFDPIHSIWSVEAFDDMISCMTKFPHSTVTVLKWFIDNE